MIPLSKLTSTYAWGIKATYWQKKKVCSNSTDLILFTKLISLSESVKLRTGERQEAFKTQDVHDSGWGRGSVLREGDKVEIDKCRKGMETFRTQDVRDSGWGRGSIWRDGHKVKIDKCRKRWDRMRQDIGNKLFTQGSCCSSWIAVPLVSIWMDRIFFFLYAILCRLCK